MKARTIALMSLTALLLCGMCICVSGDGESDVSADSSNAAVIVGTGTEYSTLEDAVSLNSGEFTVKMLRDVSDVPRIGISEEKNVTIDLNGKTIEFASDCYFLIDNGSLELTGDGIVTEKAGDYYYAPVMLNGSTDAEDYSVLTVGSGIELRGWAGIFINQNSGNNSGIKVDFAGKAISGKDRGGDNGNAIYVNGQIVDTAAHVPEITIRPGAVVDGADGMGIYAAGYAIWNIDGATITGDTAIEIRAGEMDVINSTIVGNGTPTTVTPNGNGSTTDGAGIAVAQHTTKLKIIVSVDSSAVSGFTALYESNPQNNPSDAISKVSVSVKGGEFSAINNGTVAVYSEDCTEFISGGIFSSSPDDAYIAGECTMSLISGKYCVSSVSSPGGTVSGNSTIVEAGSSATSTVILPSASVSISGSDSLGNVFISATPRTFSEAPDAIASYEITIVSGVSYTADITVAADIARGFVPLVYYIDDDGNLVPVEVVSYTSTTVTFRTTHTTPFVVMTEAEPTVTPGYDDDEDDMPYVPPTVVSNSKNDNTTTIVACAAAAVAAAMIAAFLLIDGRKP